MRAAAGLGRSVWEYDRKWDARGVKGSRGTSWVGHVLGMTVLVGLMGALHYAGFVARGGWPFKVAAVMFDLVFLFVVYKLVCGIIRMARFGRGFLRYGRFPFFLGDRFQGWWRVDQALGAYRNLTARIRCVQEEFVTTRVHNERRTSVVLYEVYGETKTLGTDGALRAGNAEVAVTFDLPDVAELATDLLTRPPRYWELEIEAEREGVDYVGRFLVPVYGRGR